MYIFIIIIKTAFFWTEWNKNDFTPLLYNIRAK